MNLLALKPYLPFIAAAVLLVVLALYTLKKRNTSSFTPYSGPYPLSEEKAFSKSMSLYGDSISVPSTLGVLLPQIWFQNLAVAGSCLTDLLSEKLLGKTFDNQIAEDYSAVQLLRYGCNDARMNRDFKIFSAMLAGFVMASRAAGKVPVLCSFTNEVFKDKNHKERWLQYNDAIKATAGRLGVHFIDLTAIPYTVAELPDGTHPDAAYNARVDDAIAKFLIDKQIFPA